MLQMHAAQQLTLCIGSGVAEGIAKQKNIIEIGSEINPFIPRPPCGNYAFSAVTILPGIRVFGVESSYQAPRKQMADALVWLFPGPVEITISWAKDFPWCEQILRS